MATQPSYSAQYGLPADPGLPGGGGRSLAISLLCAESRSRGVGLLERYTVSSTSDKKTKIGGGFNETSVKELLYNFFESKENPVLSFITTLADERTFGGGKVSLGKEVANRVTPILIQDIIDMAKEDPMMLKIVPIAIASIFGAGVQTYGKKKAEPIR